MPILRSQRIYPLALKDTAQAPINVGITAAYDYQGDPNNAYAKGNGQAHVGNFNYTVPATAPLLVEVAPGISGRDTSAGKTVNTTYMGGDLLKFGIGTSDGKGNFSIHRRYRVPSAIQVPSGSVNWIIADYRDAGGSRIALSMIENVIGKFYFRIDVGSVQIPSASAAASNTALHRNPGSIVDLHLVRNGDTFEYYLDGVLMYSSSVPSMTTFNTAWGGSAVRNGIGVAPIQDLVLIDETYWNRALSASEVSQHQADPYYGYANTVVAPTGTVTSQPAPDGQSQRFAGTTTNATSGTYTLTGSNGGVTVGPLPFAVAGDTFDFSETGLAPGAYTPTLTVTGPGGTAGVTGASAFTIGGVAGGGELYTPPVESTVTSVAVSPSTATGSTTFTAVVNGTNGPSQAVTWAASAGWITSGGVFTAPAATSSVQTITITATSVQDNTKAGTATVTIAATAPTPTVTSVAVSPASIGLNGGGIQQFNATVNGTNSPPQTVTWSASIGTITSGGLYTAPVAAQGEQSATITATSTFNTQRSGTASVTIAALPVEPEVPSVTQLGALAPSVIRYQTSTGPLRLMLNFIDTPAPPERTIVLGGRNRTITAG